MTDHADPTTITTSRDALDRWLTMWNGEGSLALALCANDFRIHFAVTETDGSTPADEIRTAADFASYLEWWHATHPGVVFTKVADALDGVHGRLIWNMTAGDVHIGGVDVFDFADDGRVTRVWSVGGQRSMVG